MSHSFRRMLAPALLLALALLALAAGRAAAAPDPSPLTAQPAVQDFGVVRVDQGEQSASVWIQNTSPDTVLVGAATVDGDSVFRVSGDGCAGQLLASGMGCGVGVGFDPVDDVASGATLHVPAAGFADLDTPLSGVGGLQRVTLAPSALDFAAVAVGDSALRWFTLTNSGNLPFQSIVAIPTGGDVGAFRVERDGCSLQELAIGAACDVQVRFAPPAAGSYAATLLLIGGDSQPTVVSLHGSGIAAVAAAAALAQPAAVAAPAAAEIAFDGPAGLPAALVRGRIELGAARCVGAARCTVVVHGRVFALAAGRARSASRRMTSARTDAVLWRLRDGSRRVRLGLPASLRGRPTLLVATLRTHVAGRPTGVRTLVVALAASR